MIKAFLLREMAGHHLNQKQLAERIGAHPTLVSKWLSEYAPSVPGSHYCNRLAEVFGYTPEYVLKLAGHLPDEESVVEGDPEMTLFLRDAHELMSQLEPERRPQLRVLFQALFSFVGDNKSAACDTLAQLNGGQNGQLGQKTA